MRNGRFDSADRREGSFGAASCRCRIPL